MKNFHNIIFKTKFLLIVILHLIINIKIITMTSNKKIFMYAGGAILVGAIGFFVYSFFKKEIVVGDASIKIGEEKDTPDGASAMKFGQGFEFPELNFPELKAPDLLNRTYTARDLNAMI